MSIDDGYWLHWRSQDTVETLVAWAAVALIVAATIGIAVTRGARYGAAEAVHAAWLFVGSFFFAGAIVKSDALRDFAALHRTVSLWLGVLLASAFVALAVAGIRSVRRRARRGPFEHAVRIFAPLVAVFLFQVTKAEWNHLEPETGRASALASARVSSSAARPRLRTLVLLFDELSPDYLYGAQSAALAGMPALRRLVAESYVYPNAFLPGGETRLAVPALFGSTVPGRSEPADGRPIAHPQPSDSGWLARAVKLGLDVRVSGWHLDYCAGIAATANQCRAVSLYNSRTIDGAFSLLHPLWTTLNLLPGDLPFGFAKIPAAVRMHERTRDSASAWMLDQLSDDRADTVFVHVNIPHVPFIADDFVGYERFVVTSERYVRQLQFVDAFVGTVLKAVDAARPPSRPIQLVVLSDHNVRRLTPIAAHERVVFLVRTPAGETGSASELVNAADLLTRVVSTGL